MIGARTDVKPANWQVTATTIHCQHVDDAVTIMVNKNWAVSCHFFVRYKQPFTENKKYPLPSAVKQRIGKCLGPDCPVAVEHRDKLMELETSREA